MIYRLTVKGEEAWELLQPLVQTVLFLDGNTLWVEANEEPMHPIILNAEPAELPGIDWEAQWRQHAPGFDGTYLPLPLGDRMLQLIPGPGFGDLSHPTTRMVLELMPDVVVGRQVVDLGCGSGVLSVASAALGAVEVWAVDIDPAAEEHTRRNAAHNDLKITVGGYPEVGSFVLLLNMILSEQKEALRSMGDVKQRADSCLCSGLRPIDRAEALLQWPGYTVVKEIDEGDWIALYLVR